MAVTTGVLTIKADDALESDLAQFPASHADIASSRQRVEPLVASDILTGAAIVGAVVTTLVGVFGRNSDASEGETAKRRDGEPRRGARAPTGKRRADHVLTSPAVEDEHHGADAAGSVRGLTAP
jgi:hypothetical protein